MIQLSMLGAACEILLPRQERAGRAPANKAVRIAVVCQRLLIMARVKKLHGSQVAAHVQPCTSGVSEGTPSYVRQDCLRTSWQHALQ